MVPKCEQGAPRADAQRQMGVVSPPAREFSTNYNSTTSDVCNTATKAGQNICETPSCLLRRLSHLFFSLHDSSLRARWMPLWEYVQRNSRNVLHPFPMGLLLAMIIVGDGESRV